MTAATRERKLAFINRFGKSELQHLASIAIARHGDAFMTDEQINTLASIKIDLERSRSRRNINNRARMAALEEVA